MIDSTANESVLVTVVAYPIDTTWVAARGDAIAMAIDPAFLVLVALQRQLVLLQATPINAVVFVHKVGVESFNFLILILIIFRCLRSCSSSMLAALGRRDDRVFSAGLLNTRLECGCLCLAHKGLKGVRDRRRRRRR
jgi:hypothetical protein